MIDQRKKQLEQRLLPSEKCICEYNKSERILHEFSWDQIEFYENNLAIEPWWEKKPPAERQEYEAGWDMNEGYDRVVSISSLTNEPW